MIYLEEKGKAVEGNWWQYKAFEGNTRRIDGRKGRKGDQDIRGSGYQESSV